MSLPSRERGLKSGKCIKSIEEYSSLPSRERGLKYNFIMCDKLSEIVAPLAGAWIEIAVADIKSRWSDVAPLAGAWIEINFIMCDKLSEIGRSPRGSVD